MVGMIYNPLQLQFDHYCSPHCNHLQTSGRLSLYPLGVDSLSHQLDYVNIQEDSVLVQNYSVHHQEVSAENFLHFQRRCLLSLLSML